MHYLNIKAEMYDCTIIYLNFSYIENIVIY